jgi:hypothetical protein
MTTRNQLYKAAKASFIPQMEELGFKMSKKDKLYFYRKGADDICEFIEFSIPRSGVFTEVAVGCWVPEMSLGYDYCKFPCSMSMICGGGLSIEGSQIHPVGGTYFDIEDPVCLETVLEDVIQGVRVIALPWFDEIKRREDLIDKVPKRITQALGDLTEMYENIISKKDTDDWFREVIL